MTDYQAATNKTVMDRYRDLDTYGKCQVMYVWVDGSGENVRCKTKTMDEVPQVPDGK